MKPSLLLTLLLLVACPVWAEDFYPTTSTTEMRTCDEVSVYSVNPTTCELVPSKLRGLDSVAEEIMVLKVSLHKDFDRLCFIVDILLGTVIAFLLTFCLGARKK